MNLDITAIPEEKRHRGRPKGTPNKVTSSFRESIKAATDSYVNPETGKKGATAWFEHLRDTEPKTFAQLQARVIPTQITTVNNEGGDAPIKLAIEIVKPE